MLEIQNLSFDYAAGDDSPVLRNVSLTLRRGELVGLAGPSGSGKSTLLRLVAGLLRPRAGFIVIDGRAVSGGAVFVPPEKRAVGLVFQNLALFPHLTVEKNVRFGLGGGFSKTDKAARSREMLRLTRLEGLERRYPHELSGGQKQRAALARALAPAPRLLLLDEPLSSLDADLKADLRQELKRILRESQTTCLLVSHDSEDLNTVCDRTVRLCYTYEGGRPAGPETSAAAPSSQ